MKWIAILVGLVLLSRATASAQEQETLPKLVDNRAPTNFEEMWSGFDPRAEPLEIEVLKEWKEEGTLLRIVRFRVGVFKGKPARLAAIYGIPIHVQGGEDKIPGLVQIHGGGQYADYRACVTNAKRGYATVSIAWAGRINAPKYRVTPAEMKLFFDGAKDEAAYRLTTDWGAVDGYHAPPRNAGNAFPSARPAAWTLDSVESPRNSGWFLCALAARRALTFLEQQPEVDPARLGVYGHSMGGKLTVMAAVDPRIKAAAPSCGGISDRDNASALFRSTLGDNVSLKEINCPIMFLSPANDFHGRIGDLPIATEEIRTTQWRVTCSPHHNHQDTPAYEVATQLWFDQHLMNDFVFPKTPQTYVTLHKEGDPSVTVKPDPSKPILAVDVFYTQHGKPDERPQDRENTVHRFWHHADATELDGVWTAKIPIAGDDQPLWVLANVRYSLESPIAGAGYYYGHYTADQFNLSSNLHRITSAELKDAGVALTLQPTRLIEDFAEGWEKEWFTYRPADWARVTNKLYDATYRAPPRALLTFGVAAEEPNRMVVRLDDWAAELEIVGNGDWQSIELPPTAFHDYAGKALPSFDGIRQLKLSPQEGLRPPRGDDSKPRDLGATWRGTKPSFRNLRWIQADLKANDRIGRE